MPRGSSSGSSVNNKSKNGRSRGAVQVTASKEQHVATLQKKATDLEQRLAAAAKDSKQQQSSANNINQYRMMLCETLSDWLLTDAETANAADAVGRLWRSSFYARIGPARARLQKDKRKAKTAAQMAAVSKQEESLQHFLAEGVTLFDYLCDKLQYQLVGGCDGDDAARGDETQDSERPWLADPDNNKSTAGIVPCLHRLYIHLGDLYRYGNHYSKAETAYWTAAHLGPSSGHAYNQLAVVCQVKDVDTKSAAAVTVYWYARSLGASKEPFPTASSNLTRLFASNREWLIEHIRNKQQAAAAPMVLAGNASRMFLAQFVDLQYTLFTTVETAAITDQFYNHLGEAATAFHELLKSSAFGDSLLCKLVTVMAFSEFHCRQQNSTANYQAARTVTLELGHCLAERVLAILQGKLNKPGQPSAPPSVRVLTPLMLLTEYLLHNANISDTAATENVANDRYKVALQSFWKSVVGIFNLLQPLLDGLPADADDGKQLKEYQELRGFAPFECFFKDGSISEAGYLSDAATAELLEVMDTSNDGTQESSMRSSQVTNLSSSAAEDAAHVKLQRFVGLRPKLLAAAALSSSSDIRIRENNVTKSLEWVDGDAYCTADARMQDGDNDDDDDDGGDEIVHMVNDDNDNEAVMMDDDDDHNKHDDVLVYMQSDAGGPALLVPGAILHGNRVSETPLLSNTMSDAASSTIAPMSVKVAAPMMAPPATTATLLQQQSNAQPVPLPFNPMVNYQDPVSVPLVGFAALPPPPGFGREQEGASMLLGNSHLPMSQSAPPGAPSLAPSFFQNLGLADYTATTRIPTIGESYHLFGGPSALETSNPFATDSTMPSFGMGSFAVPQRDGAFLPNHQDAMGFDGTTLLDSGLLNSLLMDDSPSQATTKNPFAT